MRGVPTKPVPLRWPLARTSSARRSPARAPALFAVEEAEAQGEGVGGLRVAGHLALRGDAGAVEGGPDAVGEGAVAGGVGGVAEQRGGLGDQPGGVGEVGGGDQGRVGLRFEGPFGRGGGVEPVAELRPGVPQAGVARQAGELVDPGGHARVLLAQEREVAGALVEHPGDDHRGVAPGGRRHHVRDGREGDPRDEDGDASRTSPTRTTASRSRPTCSTRSVPRRTNGSCASTGWPARSPWRPASTTRREGRLRGSPGAAEPHAPPDGDLRGRRPGGVRRARRRPRGRATRPGGRLGHRVRQHPPGRPAQHRADQRRPGRLGSWGPPPASCCWSASKAARRRCASR